MNNLSYGNTFHLQDNEREQYDHLILVSGYSVLTGVNCP